MYILSLRRTFYVCASFAGCNGDLHWLMVAEPSGGNTGCVFDKHPSKPAFVYSDKQTKEDFGVNGIYDFILCLAVKLMYIKNG